MDHYAYLVRRIRRIGPRIDLGCGAKCRPGYIGIDIRDQGQDILWDVRQGLPFADNSIQAIYTSHFVEHLTDSDLRALLVDILRVCAPQAIVEIRCPHANCIEAFYHGHLSLWHPQRVKGFVAGFARGAKAGEKYFRIGRLELAGIEIQVDLRIEKR